MFRIMKSGQGTPLGELGWSNNSAKHIDLLWIVIAGLLGGLNKWIEVAKLLEMLLLV